MRWAKRVQTSPRLQYHHTSCDRSVHSKAANCSQKAWSDQNVCAQDEGGHCLQGRGGAHPTRNPYLHKPPDPIADRFLWNLMGVTWVAGENQEPGLTWGGDTEGSREHSR